MADQPVIAAYALSDSGGSTVSALACSAPSGISEGDLLIIIVGSDETGDAAEFSINGTTYPGWTKLGENPSGSTGDAHVGVFYKIAGGSEAAVTVDAVSSNEMIGWYYRITGADPDGPIRGSNFDDFASSSTVVMTSIGIVTTVDDLCISCLVGDGGDTAPFYLYQNFGDWAKLQDNTSGTSGNDVAGCTFSGSGGDGSIPGHTVGMAVADGSAQVVLAIVPIPPDSSVGLAAGTATAQAYSDDGSVGSAAGSATAIGVGGYAAIPDAVIVPFALGLAYNVADLGLEHDFRYFRLSAHLSPDVEIPMKRFTLRRINSGTASGLSGTVTFDAFIPKGFDDILNQLEGASVTLSVASSYQNQSIFAALATVDISRVKFLADKDSVYGEAAVIYPLRPDSVFTIPNRDIIFSAPNQIRTIMRDDIFPGMFVKARGTEREVTQVTMYAEYNSGLTEILMR